MPIFVALAIAGLLLLLGGALFGHDHDITHDVGHIDHSGADHGGNEPTVSIFSLKVIGTFIMGFGGGGVLGRYEGAGMLPSSLVGLGIGLAMGLAMYATMRILYGQQSTSLVQTSTLVGKSGTVVTAIDANAAGEVAVRIGSEAPIYLARASGSKSFAKGALVSVISSTGGEIVVDELSR